jgi:predicted acyltransferase (DUF342 family)
MKKLIEDEEIKDSINFSGTLMFTRKCFVDGNVKTRAIIAKNTLLVNGSVKAPNFIWIEEGDFFVNGNIETGILFGGRTTIKAGGCIKCAGPIIVIGGPIEAKGDIVSGWKIESDRWIRAGGNIEAKGDIRAGFDISAGGYIRVDKCSKIYAGLEKWKPFDPFIERITAKEVIGEIGQGEVWIVSKG